MNASYNRECSVCHSYMQILNQKFLIRYAMYDEMNNIF